MLLSGYCDGALVAGAGVTGAAVSSLDEPAVAHTETHTRGSHGNGHKQHCLLLQASTCFWGMFCYCAPGHT
jgi:hypothetical protein